MKTLYTIGLLISFAFLTSCVPEDKLAPPVNILLPNGGNPQYISRLESGRAIYLGSKCLKCHAAEPILKYENTEWKEDILPSMNRKARLSPQEAQDLQAYVYLVLEKRKELEALLNNRK